MKNQTASELHMMYVQAFREYFNQYMAIRDVWPFEELKDFRQFMFRLGILVEMWAAIDRRIKERSRG